MKAWWKLVSICKKNSIIIKNKWKIYQRERKRIKHDAEN